MRLAAANLWCSIPEEAHPAWWGALPPEKQPTPPNIRVISTAGSRLEPEFRGGDHAGYLETSLMRALNEDFYDAAELERGEPWFSQGDPHPRSTTPERSRDYFEAWARSVANDILAMTGRSV